MKTVHLTLLLTSMCMAIPSLACECPPFNRPNQVYASDAIILATLRSQEHLPPSNPMFPGRVRATFEVGEVIYSLRDRDIGNEIVGITADNIETCGLPIEIDGTYLLMLNSNDFIGDATLSICDGTYQMDNPATDYELPLIRKMATR